MTVPARKQATRIARPVKVLVPLIQDELVAGDRAGLEHYRVAGEMLLEAREQVAWRPCYKGTGRQVRPCGGRSLPPWLPPRCCSTSHHRRPTCAVIARHWSGPTPA